MARLGGRYELRRLLGSGGMAELHLAHDLRLDRSVAAKTLRGDLAHEPALQQRFRREAKSTASLNHPAIAAVYDTGEDMTYGAQLRLVWAASAGECWVRSRSRRTRSPLASSVSPWPSS